MLVSYNEEKINKSFCIFCYGEFFRICQTFQYTKFISTLSVLLEIVFLKLYTVDFWFNMSMPSQSSNPIGQRPFVQRLHRYYFFIFCFYFLLAIQTFSIHLLIALNSGSMHLKYGERYSNGCISSRWIGVLGIFSHWLALPPPSTKCLLFHKEFVLIFSFF
jgi:hypothetical protein